MKLRVWAYALFFLSGMTSLVYQVVWMKLLSYVLGNTLYATMAILTAFMAGLAIGGYVFGKLCCRFSNTLLVYGILEGLIGLFAFLSPYIIESLAYPYKWIYGVFGFEGFLTDFLRFLLAFATLLLPTIMMGGTLPLLAEYFTSLKTDTVKGVSSLYAVNTFGAVTGCFMSAFVFIYIWGLKGAVYFSAILNILILLSVIPLAFLNKKPLSSEQRGNNGELQQASSGRLLLFLYFLTGASGLAYEIIWTRILVLHFGSNVYAFSLMLTTFLIGIAAGSFVVGRFASEMNSGKYRLLFALLQIILAFTVIFQIVQFILLKDTLLDVSALLGEPDYVKTVITLFVSAFQLIFLPTFIFGASFPAAVKIYEHASRTTGNNVGVVYTSNTAGGIAGILLAGFILIPLMGVQNGLLTLALLNLLIGLIALTAWVRIKPAMKATVIILLPVLLISMFSFFTESGEVISSAGVFSAVKGKNILYFKESVNATITVETENDILGKATYISLNGVNVAGTSPMLLCIQKLQGHLPLLLHPDPKKILHIGFGSGGTAWSVSQHPVEKIHIAEITRDVIETSDKFFKGVNHGITNDPRVKVFICDGRNLVLTTEEKYDVILSDSIHPRYSGNSSLYTKDYYLLCKDRLTDDGVLSQWLPIYSLTDRNFRMILRAFYEAFPNSSVWYINSTINPYVITTGSKNDNPVDFRRISEALENNPGIFSDLSKVNGDSPFKILDYHVISGKDIGDFTRDIPPHIDDYPAVEYESSRILDRQGSWLHNFEELIKARKICSPDLSGYSETEKETINAELDRYFSATSLNLEAQRLILHRNGEEAVKLFMEKESINPVDPDPIEYEQIFKKKIQSNQ